MTSNYWWLWIRSNDWCLVKFKVLSWYSLHLNSYGSMVIFVTSKFITLVIYLIMVVFILTGKFLFYIFRWDIELLGKRTDFIVFIIIRIIFNVLIECSNFLNIYIAMKFIHSCRIQKYWAKIILFFVFFTQTCQIKKRERMKVKMEMIVYLIKALWHKIIFVSKKKS